MKFKGFPTKEEVFKRIDEQWFPNREMEIISIEDGLGRVLGEDIYSKTTFPIFRSSQGDGIAFSFEKYVNETKLTKDWILNTDYAYADTGDDFPDEFDTVVMVEEIEFLENGGVIINDSKIEKGKNVKPRGGTIKEDDFICSKYKRLRPTDLAAIVLGGYTEIKVIKKPKISFIPTGSELVSIGTVPQRGEMIDCNTIMVKNTLIENGVEPILYPIVKDIESDLKSILQDAMEKSDIVIINGGSAKGKEDLNAKLIESYGEVICHGIKAAPGRPMCIGIIDNKPVINLPGPPIATYFGLDWCISHIIEKYYNLSPKTKPKVIATLKNDIQGPKSADFLCKVEITKNGEEYEAESISFHKQTLGRVLTTNGQHILKKGVEKYKKGEKIEVEFVE